MRNDKDEKKLFIQACQKAGLKVHNVSGEHPASGLVIRDAQGHRFIVNEELEIVKVGAASAGVSVYRKAVPGGRRMQAVFAQRVENTNPRRRKSLVKSVRGKVKTKQSG